MTQITYPIANPHFLSTLEIAKSLNTDVKKGLSQKEARQRNETLGLNIYQNQKQKNALLILLEQFKSPIVYLLLFGAIVSFYFNEVAEGIAIFIVIFLNAGIGFFMEMQARASMDALRKMDITLSKVYRGGLLHEIPSEKITPGDLIFLEAGDVVPGDARLVETNQLQCDESSLTGESLPSDKNNKEIPEGAILAEQSNMIFKGTSVVKGNGKAIITGIGLNTQLGNIASLVENSEETATPLDKKLNALTKKLMWLTLSITAIFIITGFIQGKEAFLIIETSIALAVAAIPEGLPIVATIALAYGMLLMAKKNAIVKKLSSVETLGGTNIILTDKTGTLTENKIYVNTFCFPQEKLEVTIENEKLKFITSGISDNNAANFNKIVMTAALCNNAAIEKIDGEIKETGDPLEIALLQLSAAAGNSYVELKKDYARLSEEPFNSDTKIMGTLHKSKEGHFVAAKGSVEHLLVKCKFVLIDNKLETLHLSLFTDIKEEAEKMSENGLRVLAFAYKSEKEISKENFLNNLTYAGMIGFLDPPRKDVKQALLSCREAGIKVIMITGDHPKTALNIAEKTGLVNAGEGIVMNGNELPEKGPWPEELKLKIFSTSVFARATPKQKLDIADLYQKEGNIVAMTGDGINDAPALKKADVGIAMGLRGTQVAKETADIILKNDSFTSIAEAVAHGREIFKNIQKFVIYLISCNLSEIFIITLLGFIWPDSTLLPLQILFINMVTDVFPALALGMGKGNESVMRAAPRNPKEDIISFRHWKSILWYAFVITGCISSGVYYCKYFITSDPAIGNNVAFFSLALAQLWHVFNMASVKSPVLKNEITQNKYIWIALFLCFGSVTLTLVASPLSDVMKIKLPTFQILLLCTIISLLPLLIIQTVRRIRS